MGINLFAIICNIVSTSALVIVITGLSLGKKIVWRIGQGIGVIGLVLSLINLYF